MSIKIGLWISTMRKDYCRSDISLTQMAVPIIEEPSAIWGSHCDSFNSGNSVRPTILAGDWGLK